MPDFADILDESVVQDQQQKKRFDDILDKQTKPFSDIVDSTPTGLEDFSLKPEVNSTADIFGQKFNVADSDATKTFKMNPKLIDYEYYLENDVPVLKQTSHLEGGIVKEDVIRNLDKSPDIRHRAAFFKIRDNINQQITGVPTKADDYYIDLVYQKMLSESSTIDVLNSNAYRVLNTLTLGGWSKLEGGSKAAKLAEAEDLRDEVIPIVGDDWQNAIRRAMQFETEISAGAVPFIAGGSVLRGLGVGTELAGIMSQSPRLSRITAQSLRPFQKVIEKQIPEIVASGIDSGLLFGGLETYSELVNSGEINPRKIVASLVTGAYFPTFAKGISEAYAAPARKQALKKALKGIVLPGVGTSPQILIDRAADIEKEQKVDFLTALGIAAQDFGDNPRPLVENAMVMAIFSASGLYNKFTRDLKHDQIRKSVADKIVNGDLTKEEADVLFKNLAKREIPKVTQKTVEETAKAAESPFKEINKGDILQNKLGNFFEVEGKEKENIILRKQDGGTVPVSEKQFKDTGMRKIEKPAQKLEKPSPKIELEKGVVKNPSEPPIQGKEPAIEATAPIESKVGGELGRITKAERISLEQEIIRINGNKNIVKNLSDSEIINKAKNLRDEFYGKGAPEEFVLSNVPPRKNWARIDELNKARVELEKQFDKNEISETEFDAKMSDMLSEIEKLDPSISELAKGLGSFGLEALTAKGQINLEREAQKGIINKIKQLKEDLKQKLEATGEKKEFLEKLSDTELTNLAEQKNVIQFKLGDVGSITRGGEPVTAPIERSLEKGDVIKSQIQKKPIQRIGDLVERLKPTIQEGIDVSAKIPVEVERRRTEEVSERTVLKSELIPELTETLKTQIVDLKTKQEKAVKDGKQNLANQYQKQIEQAEQSLRTQQQVEEPSKEVELTELKSYIAYNFSDVFTGYLNKSGLETLFLKLFGYSGEQIGKLVGVNTRAANERLNRMKKQLLQNFDKFTPKEREFAERLFATVREINPNFDSFAKEVNRLLDITSSATQDAKRLRDWYDSAESKLVDPNQPDKPASQSVAESNDLDGSLRMDLGLGGLYDVTKKAVKLVQDKIDTKQSIKEPQIGTIVQENLPNLKYMFLVPGKSHSPRLNSLFFEGKKATNEYSARGDFSAKLFDSIFDRFSKQERFKIWEALKERERIQKMGLDSVDPISRLSTKEQNAANFIRQYYDLIRERLINKKIDSIKTSLSDVRKNALEDILTGDKPENVFENYKLKEVGRKDVLSALEEVRSAEKWGIEDYITRAEMGSFRAETPEGLTIAVGETKTQLKEELRKRFQSGEFSGLQFEELVITNEFAPGVDFPTQLTRRGFFRLINEIASITESTSKDVLQDLRNEFNKTGRKLPFTVKPANKWARVLEQRKVESGVLEGEKDPNKILPAYAYMVEKKFALDPFLERARITLPQLSGTERKIAEDYIQDIKGRVGLASEIVDELMYAFTKPFVSGAEKIPAVGNTIAGFFEPKPFAYGRSLSTIRSITANLKLGYRPIATIFNYVGGRGHTWIRYGNEWRNKGNEYSKTDEFRKILQENENYIGLEASIAGGVDVKRQSLWKPLGLFQKVEIGNRTKDFSTALTFGKESLKLSGQELTDFAIQSVWSNQFLYTTAAMPKFMRGQFGRTVFQFKPYLVNELQFMASLKGVQRARWLAFTLATGGAKGFVYLLKTVPILGLLGFWDDAEKWMNDNFPRASRGIGGLLGVDVSAQAIAQLPTERRIQDFSDFMSLFGASLGDLAKLWRDVVAPAIKGQHVDFSDVGNWMKRVAPVVNYWSQVVESLSSKSGYITDERGRIKYNADKSDRIKYLIGVKPLEQEIKSFESFYLRQVESKQQKEKLRLVEHLVDAIESQDKETVDRRVGDLREFILEMQIDQDSINRTIKQVFENRKLPPQHRMWKYLPKNLRPRVKFDEQISE